MENPTKIDAKELEDIYPELYDELRTLAATYMRGERQDHTLQPTALVHETYLRLNGQDNTKFDNRNHFFSVASRMMRRILVSHAIRSKRDKRGGEAVRVTLDKALEFLIDEDIDILELNQALEKFATIDERAHRIFEARFFGGLSVPETAEVERISAASVKRDWVIAKAFIKRELFG